MKKNSTILRCRGGGGGASFTLNKVNVSQGLAYFLELDMEVVHVLIPTLNFIQVCCAGGVRDPDGRNRNESSA